MEEMQAMLRERDDKLAELTALREELDEERRRAADLANQMLASHEMEESEKQRLVNYCVAIVTENIL